MTHKYLTLVVCGGLAILSAACGIEVQKRGDGKTATVNVASPFGSMHLKTDVDASKTGLPVYPGARPTDDGDEASSADVNISGGNLFGVKVVAVEMESDDAVQPIVDFYKREMQQYGVVTECHGDISFKGGPTSHRPVCEDRAREHETQLLVGSESHHRIVSVKPRGSGSEFAMVSIQTGN
jgi:hypothetical protein